MSIIIPLAAIAGLGLGLCILIVDLAWRHHVGIAVDHALRAYDEAPPERTAVGRAPMAA